MRRVVRVALSIWCAFSLTVAETGVSVAQSYSALHSSAGAEADSGGIYTSASSEPDSANAYSSRLETRGYVREQSESRALTEYLAHHKLPLVGAQVLQRADGQRIAILYGFVGSDFGKTDAAKKARRFLGSPTLRVDNRINVRPELLTANHPASTPGYEMPGYASNPESSSLPGTSSNPADSSGRADNSYPGTQSYLAQRNQLLNNSQLGSMAPLIALLGVLAMGLAGGNSGFSFGGASPFSSFGSPVYGPYAAPFGTPYSSYGGAPYGPSPYGGAPYSASPYGTSPYSTSPYGHSPYNPYP